MNGYLTQFTLQTRSAIQYRMAAMAGVVTQLFFGWVRVAVLAAFYAATTAPQSMTLAQAIDYTWLAQALMLVAPFRLEPHIASAIRQGGLAFELIRPVDTYWLWYSRAIALRVAQPTLRAIPLLVIMGSLGYLSPPASLSAGFGFLIAVALAVVLATAMSVLISLTLLWTISGVGITDIARILCWPLSGLVLPLPLLPDTWRPIIEALPFAGMLDAPIRIYTGITPPSEYPELFALQVAWTVVLWLAGRALLRRGLRRAVSFGG
jgi:ABC-2 type transport system permease protein